MNYQEFFKGKKITLMGLGLLGRGVGDAKFLSECGASVLVTDLKSDEELKESVAKLKGVPNITFKLGGHDLKDFGTCDMVLKAAGVPLDSPYIAEAKKHNIPVYMGAALLCKLAEGVTVLGVTGTRGKSTVAHLCSHILKNVRMSYLAGNVRDTATLPLLKVVKAGDVVVLELDSWQLQGFADIRISPHIAVFTTFMDDHMNYYAGDREQYFSDKAGIYRYQDKDDTLVAGEDVASVIASRNEHNGKFVIARRSDVPRGWKPMIPGDHNLLNIACAIEACRALGVVEDDIKKGVESFVGVEGRLQLVKEINGIKIYNDNNATTPDATIAGIQALRGQNVILIAGGSDKGLPLDSLMKEMEKCKAVILIPGTGSDRVKINADRASGLREALEKAREVAKPGEVILFSPAFASFGLFKNEYDRNDQFMDMISSLS